jgi:hypothetical protein
MRASGRRKEAEEIIKSLKEIAKTDYVIANCEFNRIANFGSCFVLQIRNSNSKIRNSHGM